MDTYVSAVRAEVARIYGIPFPEHLATLADQAEAKRITAEAFARTFGARFKLDEIPAEPEVFLIGCSSTKAPRRCMARDLYIGDLFRKSVAYAESRRGRWFVLSARHGLVYPTQALEPYDLMLANFTVPQQRAWGDRVREQLERAGITQRPLIVLAGRLYRDALGLPPEEIKAPMEGLFIGEQRRWLAERIVEAI